jgi:hypothetical protein
MEYVKNKELKRALLESKEKKNRMQTNHFLDTV